MCRWEWVGACACALAALVVLGAPTLAEARYTLYVSGAASEDVAGFAIGSDGSLAPVGGSPAPSGKGASGVALAPDGRHVYVANSTGDSVAAFQVTLAGTLAPMPGSPFSAGRGPFDLAATPDGRHIFVSNLLSSNVSAFDMGETGGGLSPLDGASLANGTAPAGVAVSPDGRHLYVAAAAARSIYAFELNRETGALTAVPGSPFPAAGLPGDLAISPDGRHLYASALHAGVSAFSIDPVSGALGTVAGSAFQAGVGTESIAIAPSGQFLYAANAASGDVSAFAISPSTGVLTPIGGSPFAADGGPAGLALTPDGRYLYASSTRNSKLHGFQISFEGKLAPLQGSPFAANVRNPGVEAMAISPNQAPVASFEVSPAAINQPTSFDASASQDPDGTIVRYDWDFGDGGKLSDGGPTPTYVYRSFGTYTVTLTVTDDGGCSTVLVSTGETVHCNAGAQAEARRAIDLEQPGLRFSGKRVQRSLRTISIRAICSKACTVTARGTLIVKWPGKSSRRRAYRLRSASAALGDGEAATLRLRLSKVARKAAGSALKQGGSVKANISGDASDQAGIVSRPKSHSVRLKRR